MNITRTKNKSGIAINMEGELTIYTVSQAKQALVEECEKLSDSVALDLKSLSEIDTAGLQLLLFFQKHLNGLGKKLHINKSNEQVDALLNQLDVAAYFTLEN